MPTKDAHLYRPANSTSSRTSKALATSSPGGLTFSSAFSTLIAASATSDGASKPRSSSKKNDFFATHNRGSKKRAAADMLAEAREPGRGGSSENLDEASWRRAKRKMDEKARMYAALKRGDIDDKDDRYDVDFDQKWAKREEEGASSQDDSDEESDQDDGGNEQVEYVDELGRTRTGSRREMQREQVRIARQKRAQEADADSRGVPTAPSQVIYGDAVQTQAFDVDEGSAAKMEDLARKRDKEETPPPDEHYDASKEIRTKGTGFYQFSQDKETREAQMRELDEIRAETERVRAAKQSEREETKRRRQQEIEERRRIIREKKGKAMANRFLNGLEEEMQATATEPTAAPEPSKE